MNSIMACDEVREESEFLSALNASLAHFVHKTLKDEQVECIRRIVCHRRDVLAVLPTGFGKSAIYQLIPKVLFNLGRTVNAKTTVAVVSPLDYIRKQQVASIEKAKPTSYLTASPTFSLTDILIRGRQTNSQVIVSGVPFPTRQKQKGRLIAG